MLKHYDNSLLTLAVTLHKLLLAFHKAKKGCATDSQEHYIYANNITLIIRTRDISESRTESEYSCVEFMVRAESESFVQLLFESLYEMHIPNNVGDTCFGCWYLCDICLNLNYKHMLETNFDFSNGIFPYLFKDAMAKWRFIHKNNHFADIFLCPKRDKLYMDAIITDNNTRDDPNVSEVKYSIDSNAVTLEEPDGKWQWLRFDIKSTNRTNDYFTASYIRLVNMLICLIQ